MCCIVNRSRVLAFAPEISTCSLLALLMLWQVADSATSGFKGIYIASECCSWFGKHGEESGKRDERGVKELCCTVLRDGRLLMTQRKKSSSRLIGGP